MSQHKVWFVTGASRGFGRLWTEAALKRGDKVVATARDPETLGNLVRDYGDAVLPLALDVTDRDAVFRAVNAGHEHFGRLDVILSNAGYGYIGAIEEVAADDVRTNFETNVFGTIAVIQAALPLLRAQGGGHILTLSSIGGIISAGMGGIYGATKFAVEALSETLSREVTGFGIKVTIIEPGPYATEFSSSIKVAPAMAEYDEVRAGIMALRKSVPVGDPAATVDAILRVVDAEEPPLRLLLGALLPIIKNAYEERIESWESWADVSVAAQGKLVG